MVTGTEVLTGRVSDRNGPWLSDRLRELGVDLAHITIVGDRPADMLAALRFHASEGVDLVLTSGGLGPTADDLTAEVVGGFCGREMVLDEALEARIAEILSPLAARFPGLDMEAVRVSNRKQAVVPEGATILEPVGTAPGLVVGPAAPGGGPTVVVLPGPRASFSRCGARRLRPPPCGRRSKARPSTASRCCACSGYRNRRSPRPCAWPRRAAWSSGAWRSRPACAAARSRS